MQRYLEVKAFIETNQRNSSLYPFSIPVMPDTEYKREEWDGYQVGQLKNSSSHVHSTIVAKFDTKLS